MHNLKKSLYLILAVVIVLVVTIAVYISTFFATNNIEDIFKEIIGISLFIIISLFFTIKYFVVKPLLNMIKIISTIDKDGIPSERFSLDGSKEISVFANTINMMIDTIKYSRKNLIDNQNKLKLLLEMSPTAVRIAKNDGEKIVFANNSYLKLLGITIEELPNKNPKSYYPKETIYQDLLNSLNKDESIENRLIPLNINNSEIWVIATYMNIIYDSEKAVIAWFHDVTDKIQIQKKIEEQKNEFETIFNYSIDGLAIVDLNGNFLEFNASFMKMIGFTREELLQTSCLELVAPEDIQLTKDALQDALEYGFAVNIEKSYVIKNRQNITVNFSMVLLPDKKRILLSTKDMTQHKLMESQAKLASMGEMIGNIAHQWRQPLSLISTIASGIKVQSEFGQFDEKSIIPDMDNIIKQTTYLSNTIDDFRNFIKNENERSEVQISNIIKKVLSIVSPSIINHHITVIQNNKDDMILDGYENQLIQALINILNNSKDALKEHIKEGNDRLIFIETKTIINGFIIKIKDNAGGIPENVIKKIFEPYFTTKHKSIGTGIGLSITHQIITKHHDATITASNETYEYNDKTYTGACFTILFNRNSLK
jgi:PAS domain S-box-containing protein